VNKVTTCEEFVKCLIDTNLITPNSLQKFIQSIPASQRPTTGEALAKYLVAAEWLTRYQADAVLKKQFDRLTIAQYELLDQIGAGGMGAVYKARHRRMKRIVAIKILNRRSEDWDDKSKRFDREIQVLSSLQHPNIVVAYDADECDAGPFFVMEYVPGKDLDWLVRTHGPMEVPEAVECIIQSAQGLDYAHSKNVIHRDVKPANLLRVDETSSIKIADLGLARLRTNQHLSGSQSSLLTEVGQLVGTVAYMAPEQTLAVDAVDHRCDIYSLGCTLFFLLNGRPPYEAASAIDTIMQHRVGPIPPLQQNREDVPSSLGYVFERMVAKSIDDRYESMTQVIAALKEVSALKQKAKRVAGSTPLPRSSPEETEVLRLDESTHSETTVLLVEPSSAQAGVIRSFLESLGCKQIQRLITGTEVLLGINRIKPDVVLSAMHLDDMTGLELARYLIANEGERKIGFVLISSSSDVNKLEQQAAELGVVLLAKPFDRLKLSVAISIVTGKGSNPQ
jgi:serine/threonine protein kinase